jgi:hypothetical protein
MFPPVVGQSVSGIPDLADTQPGRISLPLSADAVQRLAKVYRLILDQGTEPETRAALADVGPAPATMQPSAARASRREPGAKQTVRPMATP